MIKKGETITWPARPALTVLRLASEWVTGDCNWGDQRQAEECRHMELLNVAYSVYGWGWEPSQATMALSEEDDDEDDAEWAANNVP